MRGPSTEITQEASQRPGLSAVGSVVRRHDRDRFQTALFAPGRHREALFALYAFNYEIARVREIVREPMLGQIRLQWWREVVDAAYADAIPRRHQIVEALSMTIRDHSLSRDHFDRLIDARERDLDDTPPATLEALEEYAEGSSSRLIQLALEVLGAATPEAQVAAAEVGIAYALAGLIRAMPAHAAAGRIMIPDDVAAEAGLDRGDYAARRGSPALRHAVAILTGAVTRRLAAARAMRRDLPKTALPALLPARIAEEVVKRLERAEFDPFAGAGLRDPLQSWRLVYAALRRRF